MPARPMLRRAGTGTTSEREQADRHRDAGGEHGMTGRLHRDDDGILVAASVRAFLAPARHQEQRVVDGDAEPDQGDEELDDDADVGERRQQQHQHERRQDGHGGDEQREQGEERREDEEQHEQGTGGAEQYLDQDAGAVLFAACGEQRVRRQAAVEARCCGGCFAAQGRAGSRRTGRTSPAPAPGSGRTSCARRRSRSPDRRCSRSRRPAAAGPARPRPRRRRPG